MDGCLPKIQWWWARPSPQGKGSGIFLLVLLQSFDCKVGHRDEEGGYVSCCSLASYRLNRGGEGRGKDRVYICRGWLGTCFY